jgi:hypothetical protein
MFIEIAYGDDGQHPRHERLKWITEVHPVTVQIEKRLGYPETEMGEVVLTASKYPAAEYAGPGVPLPRLGTATTGQLLKELEARLSDDSDHEEAVRLIRRVYAMFGSDDLAYRTVDHG